MFAPEDLLTRRCGIRMCRTDLDDLQQPHAARVRADHGRASNSHHTLSFECYRLIPIAGCGVQRMEVQDA